MKVTKEEFIRRSNLIHNFKYDYSKSNFTGTNNKVIIICPKHGEFEQRANAHFSGQNCPKCNNTEQRLKSFIRKSIKKHNDKYDYSLIEDYNNLYDIVSIICPNHGIFKQVARNHINGFGCKRCGCLMPRVRGKQRKNKITFNEWIERLNINNKMGYDYSLIKEIKSDRHHKLPIVCKNGHIFYMTIKDHLKGNGCKFCSQPCRDTESFIRLSNERHGNKYDYSKSVYRTQNDKLIIICTRHGEFLQKPANHYHLGRGCRRCGESKGELEIRKWLESKNIEFKKEHTFEDCVNLGKLRFDFYLPGYNTCIEFDGLQHFRPIEQFGGVEEFERVKQRDSFKNQYCLSKNIKLIRINYKNLKRSDIVDKLTENIQV